MTTHNTQSTNKVAPLLASLAALCVLLFFSGCTVSGGYSVQLYPAFQQDGQMIRNKYAVASVVLGNNVTIKSIDGKKLGDGWGDGLNREENRPFRFAEINIPISVVDLIPGWHTFSISYFKREENTQSRILPMTFTVNLQAGRIYRPRFRTIGKKESSWFSSKSSQGIEWFFDGYVPPFFKDGVDSIRSFAPNPFNRQIIYSDPIFSREKMREMNLTTQGI